ncbi:MAG: hypothetical protein RR565_04735 [Erysipelothrix sp.]
MTNLIDNYFYDKTVEFYTYEEKKSSEGGRPTKGQRETKRRIKCNIQPTAHHLLKEKYGLDIDAKYLITCSTTESIEKRWLTTWNNEELEVVEVLPYDSHLMILCQ